MDPHCLHVVKPKLVAATLGSTKDAQRIENLSGESTDAFMLHYNFYGYVLVKLAFQEVQREEKLDTAI